MRRGMGQHVLLSKSIVVSLVIAFLTMLGLVITSTSYTIYNQQLTNYFIVLGIALVLSYIIDWYITAARARAYRHIQNWVACIVYSFIVVIGPSITGSNQISTNLFIVLSFFGFIIYLFSVWLSTKISTRSIRRIR